MRRLLLAASALGALIFGGIALVAAVHPVAVERASHELLSIEVERRVGERLDDLSASTLGKLATRATGRMDVDIEATRRAIQADVPARVAATVADMMRADCECRKRLVDISRQAYRGKLASLTEARERLGALIEHAYADVRHKLLREVIIFSASNAVAFLMLGLIVLVRPAARLQLGAVAVVLVGAVDVTSMAYLFGQNWFHTILFSDYVGWGYAAYLSGVIVLLADIVFNRARFTTRVLNAVFNLLGSALQAAPC